MRRARINVTLLAVIASTFLTACSREASDTSSGEPPESATRPPSLAIEHPTDEAAQERPPSDLAGSSWWVDEYEFVFQPGGNVLVRGGRFEDIMPTGAPSRYTLEGSRVTIDVADQTYTGTWDGEFLLIIDGRIAHWIRPE